MKYQGFIGPWGKSRAGMASPDTLINLCPEYVQSRKGFVFYGRPGLNHFRTFDEEICAGLWAGDGRLFAVMGSKLYEVFNTGGADPLLRGDVGQGEGLATMVANGGQLLVANAGKAYIDTGTTLVTIKETIADGVVTITGGTAVAWVSGDQFGSVLAGDTITINGVDYTQGAITRLVNSVTNPTNLVLSTPIANQSNVPYAVYREFGVSSVAWLDGYGLAAVPNSKQWRWSSINDFKYWDGADIENKEAYPDNLGRVITHDRRIWLFGLETSEVWENAGLPPPASPFARVANLPMGAMPWTPSQVGPTSLMWLANFSQQGDRVVMRADGVQPVRASTHELEAEFATYSTVFDAEGYPTLHRGHYFYVLSFPTAQKTWAYDLTASIQSGEPIWQQWAYFQNGQYGRHRGRVHAHVLAWGKHIVGDYANGVLYEERMDALTDNGVDIKRERTAPVIMDEDKKLFFGRLELLMQNGVVAQGVIPQMMLEYSNDGGKTFGNVHHALTGAVGEYERRVIWRQLGASRRRVFRLTSTAAMEHCWLDAFIRVRPSTEP
jgi:hypothetical protein